MNNVIDFSKVTAVTHIKGSDDDETNKLREMLQKAEKFLKSFPWCSAVEQSFLGIGIAEVLGVFLFQVRPSRENVDEWNWVVIGDIPPAYISACGCPNPATALDAYIGAMEDWVAAVRAGKSVSGLIPVNVPATKEWADRLESRLAFIDKEILQDYRDDLKA